MADRETRHAKGFSKRLLSSFRKGKKSNVHDNIKSLQTYSQEPAAGPSLEKADTENAVDLEATVDVDSPTKQTISSDGPVTPKRNLRHVLPAVDSGISSNASTPRALRFELGGTMSASTDSGIDCSILMAEKSPEHFVMFTRRESERLRHEQAMNGSMLETLTEVDKSLSDSDSEKVGNDKTNDGKCADVTLSERQSDSCKSDTAMSGTKENSNLTHKDMDTSKCHENESSCSTQKSERMDGDYVLLSGENTPAKIVDLTEVVKANKSKNETRLQHKDGASETNTSEPSQTQNNKSRSVEDYYMSYYANRTDETKSAEAKMKNEDSPSASASVLNASHAIVYPKPVTSSSSCAASLNSTLPAIHLSVNENSAFTKSKSFKRSVSKGFFEKLRHYNHNKECPDQSMNQSMNHSHVGEKSFTNLKNSAFSKLRKLRVKKGKSMSSKHSGDQTIKLFNHLDPGNVVMDDEEPLDIVQSQKLKSKMKETVQGDKTIKLFNHLDPGNVLMDDEECPEIVQRRKPKSPIMKDIVCAGSANLSFSENTNMKANASSSVKSPVYKEVISESVRNELEASIQSRRSPVGQETSIEEITNDISRMTSALCSSSAESIACICDCKNRLSDPECCDKKKLSASMGYIVDCGKSSENQNECDQIKVSKCLDRQRTPSPKDFNGCIELSCTPQTSGNPENQRHNLSVMNGSVYVEHDKDFENDVLNSTVLESKAKTQNDCQSVQNEKSCDTLNQSKLFICDNESCDILNQSKAIMCDDESCDEYCDCGEIECSCDECTNLDQDLDCSNCCNISPNTANLALLSSSSDSESDSVGGSYEDLTIGRKVKDTKVKDSRSSGSSTQSSASSSECVTPKKSKSNSGVKELGGESSPFSVSFHEVVCENGDVMYVEESFSDYMNTCWNDDDERPSPTGVGTSPSATVNLNQSASYRTPTLNQSLSHGSRRSNSRSKVRSLSNEREKLCSPLSSPPQFEEDTIPTLQNLSADSSFTNVSFEGSFANSSYVVRNRPDDSLSQSVLNSSSSSHFNRNSRSQSQRQRSRPSSAMDASYNDCLNTSSVGDISQSHNSSFFEKFHQTRLLSGLNDSQFLHYGRINPSNNLNDLIALNLSKRTSSTSRHSAVDLNSSASVHNVQKCKTDPRLNRSMPYIDSQNKSFNRQSKMNRSFHGTSPASSPLDLSMSRPKSPEKTRRSSSDKNWVGRHVGQVYSPAKRVLHKNQGLSERDLCKQILDLYVSDAEESGFEVADMDSTLNSSSFLNASADGSAIFEGQSERGDSSGSEGESSHLQYGTYVAPRNVVKETNVDDFTTTSVWTCYSGEARTRRLQGRGDSSIYAEDRRRAAFEELNNSTSSMRKKHHSRKGNKSMDEDSLSDSMTDERSALSDRTNKTPRLSKLEMAKSLNDSVCSQSVEVPTSKERKVDPKKLNDKKFDELTMMHTVRNGKRQVRCLSMDESQNVVKYYPPPKEASRISWGQTISELDLYRHSPRKTPVKTRPILAQKENSYPYEDDSPSPIVLTRMRKPKSLAKKYKNWPWS